MPKKAGTSKHLNRVVAAGEKRALDLEPKLVEVLAPILDDAGDRAAREFESRVTALAASAFTSRDILCLLSFSPDEGRALVTSLALTADAGVRRNSAMIAVKPRPEEAAALAHDGGHEPDDLHVTLAYLGSYDGPLSALAEALAPVAADHAPLEGKVAGRGAFENNGKGAPLILLPSVPGLVELRVAATQALVDAGFDYGRDYGYLPHMTVDYTPEDRMPDPERVGKPLHFDELLIVRGNDEVVRLPLVGAPPMTAAAGEDRKLSDALGSVDDARRHLATALHASDEAGVKDAQKALGDAEKRLSRELQAQGEHKNKRAKSADEIADQIGQAQAAQVAEVEQQTGGESARGTQLAKQVVEKGAEEQRIEEGIASEIERLTDRPVGEAARRLQESLARPLAGRADWISPLADEIVNVSFLIEELRSKTDPVRQAVSETMVRSAVEGAGIEFDVNNPLASKVLARSASQITNIAETTQLNVMRIIKAAHDEGLSIPDTAAAIRGGMRDASTVRATLIARTELAAAVNGGSLAAAQIVSDALDEPYYKQWLTAPGARYPRHEDYEGLDEQTQRLDEAFDVSGVALQFPGDPDGPPEEVCNCFVGTTSVVAPGLEMGFRRRYEGDLVRVEAVGVDALSGTPNHPVLTSAGWKPLGLLREGDYLVRTLSRKREGAVDPDVDHAPSAIEQVFGALASREVPRRIRGRAVQFHGDPSADGEVEVVSTDGDLGLRIDPAFSEERREAEFVGASESAALLSPASLRVGLVIGGTATASRTVSGSRELPPLGAARLSHASDHRLGAGSRLQSDLAQGAGDDSAADAVALGERIYGGTFDIALAKVVRVERAAFHGEVFNLQTETGTYLANGIIVHNCRCTIVYLTPEEAAEQGVDLGGESQKPTPATPEEAQGLARPLFDEIDQGVPVPKPDMDLPNMVLATRVAEGNWTAGTHDLDQFIGPGAYYSDRRLSAFLDDLPEGESDLGMTIKATKATNEQGEPIITLDHLGKAGPIIQTGGLDETAKRLANFLDKENAGRGTPKVGGMFQRAGEMSLSKTEADTIVRWTRHEYEDIEVALRDRKPITRAQQVVVDRLDRVLDQAPMLEGDPLYRGYQRLGTPLPKVGEQIQIGRGGFAATTSSGDLASTFGDVVYRVEGPTQAFPVQGLSAKPEELEYLSPRSQRFEVTKIGPEKFASGERTVIDVRAIPRPGMPVGEKVFTADPEVAAKAIASGVPVVLSQPTQIATLIDDLGKIAKQAQAKGEAAPRLNLGSVSVPGTNLFTQESIGVPRVEMPQLKGVPSPGSLADKLEHDSRGEVDIAPLFYRHLQDEGTQIEYGVERRVDQLRATQTELDGGKVAGIMDYLDGGGEIEGAIPVTADGYVIDGHHRWAAVTGLDFKYNADKPWEIDTDIVHKDITSVVSEANIFAAEYGIPQSGIAATMDTAKAEATIGITPFRPEDTALGFYDTMKAKQFEADIVPTAEQYGVTVSRQERVSGVWMGESEPSYSLLAHDGKEGVENFAATMRAKYNQDGVMVFAPNPNGESYAYTIHRVNAEEVTPMLSEYGIQGATVSADGITIMGDEALADNVTELATKINRVVTARRGDLAFVERNDPVRSLGEVNAKHPLVDLYTTEKPEGITVSMIRVPIEARGKGEASAAMSDVLDYADRKGLPVALTPEAISGGMSTTQLKAWYKRLGFEPNKGRTADLRFKESMIRRPADIGLARPSFDPAGFVNTKIEATDIIIAGLERQLAKAPDSISLQTELRRAHARKDTFVGLRDHPDPQAELDAISAEYLELDEKSREGTITADEQAQFSKLQEQTRSLEKLAASKEYTELLEGAIAERTKAGDPSTWSGAKIKREQAKVEAKATSAAALLREKLKAKGENEPIAVEAHAVPWSISGPHEMGPGVAWRQNGIVYTAELREDPRGYGVQMSAGDTAAFYQNKVEPWVGALPPEVRGRLDRVNIYNGKSPDEEYWSRVYGNPGSILAQTGNKAVTFWHSNDEVATKSITQGTFEHEAGHLTFEGGGPLDEDEWITAANADSEFGRMKYGVKSGDYIYGNTPDSFRGFMVGVRGVSDYGTSSLVEDWAESIRLFLLDRRIGSIGTLAAVHAPGGFDEIVTPLPKGVSDTEPVRFADVYPNRVKLIEEWLGLGDLARLLPTPAGQ